jgi:hypothetical protein
LRQRGGGEFGHNRIHPWLEAQCRMGVRRETGKE